MASSYTNNSRAEIRDDNCKDLQHTTTKKQKFDHDLFRQTKINCFEEKEERASGSRSVYFSSFNPVWPILACGLNEGVILILEGKRKTDLLGNWGNKRWFKMNVTSAMTDLGWNIDGTLLLTAFLEGKLFLWNKNTENVMEVNNPSCEQIWANIWNPLLPNLFATRNNGVILVWDVFFLKVHKKSKKRITFPTNALRDFVWISANQFVSCDDGLILLYHIETDSPLKSFSHGETILTVSWNNFSNLLVCLSRDGTITVMSMTKNEPDFVSKNERMKRPTCITWYPTPNKATEPKSTLIACGLENGSVVLWDIAGKNDPVRCLLEQSNSIWDVSFSPDGMFLTSIDLHGEFIIWSTETWKIVFQSRIPFRASQRILQWGGDGHKLAIANSSEEIYVIEAVEC